MSSFSRRYVLGAAIALSGCGFTPAYGPAGGAQKLQGTVLVDAPTDRDTYLMTQSLEERLGRSQNAAYGLSYALTLNEERMAVTGNNITTRFNVVGKATYALRDLASGAVLTNGIVDSFTGYSADSTTVATLSAKGDARARVISILADQITNRLIAISPDLPG